MKWNRSERRYELEKGENLLEVDADKLEKVFANAYRKEKSLRKHKLTKESQAYKDLTAREYMLNSDEDLAYTLYQFQYDKMSNPRHVREDIEKANAKFNAYVAGLEDKRFHNSLFETVKGYFEKSSPNRVKNNMIEIGGVWYDEEEFKHWFYRQWKSLDSEAKAMLYGYDTGGGDVMEQFMTFESTITENEDPFEYLELFTANYRKEVNDIADSKFEEYKKQLAIKQQLNQENGKRYIENKKRTEAIEAFNKVYDKLLEDRKFGLAYAYYKDNFNKISEHYSHVRGDYTKDEFHKLGKATYQRFRNALKNATPGNERVWLERELKIENLYIEQRGKKK